MAEEDVQLQFGRHACAKPGCTGQRKDHKLLCSSCWKRLPKMIKVGIRAAFETSRMVDLDRLTRGAVKWLQDDDQHPTLF